MVMKPPIKEVNLAEHRDNFLKQSLMGLCPTANYEKRLMGLLLTLNLELFKAEGGAKPAGNCGA